jgi:hypothetical protein
MKSKWSPFCNILGEKQHFNKVVGVVTFFLISFKLTFQFLLFQFPQNTLVVYIKLKFWLKPGASRSAVNQFFFC